MKNEECPATELANARAEFNTRTNHQFDRVTDYCLLAEYCALNGWAVLAAIFLEAFHASRIPHHASRINP